MMNTLKDPRRIGFFYSLFRFLRSGFFFISQLQTPFFFPLHIPIIIVIRINENHEIIYQLFIAYNKGAKQTFLLLLFFFLKKCKLQNLYKETQNRREKKIISIDRNAESRSWASFFLMKLLLCFMFYHKE